MKEAEMRIIAGLIKKVLNNPDSEDNLSDVQGTVRDLCDSFPIYQYLDKES
jgi:glycine hydroxymethyltransferase